MNIREKNKTNNINCIHLRLEEDAVEHWAKENKMTPNDFKKIIEDKYIDVITRNLKKEDVTLHRPKRKMRQTFYKNKNFVISLLNSVKAPIRALYYFTITFM